jgi:hypothetical protein
MTNEASNFTPANEKAYLLAKNPSSIFLCWTWNRARTEVFEAGGYESEITVRLFPNGDKAAAAEFAVQWNSGKLYIKLPTEGGTYAAVIYARRKDGVQEKLLESNAASAPVSAQRGRLSSGYSSAEFFRREPL